MKINKWIVLVMLALLAISAMGFLSYRVFASAATQDCAPNHECEEQNEAETADEVAPANTRITADEAQAIAEKANPGANTLAVEFDREAGKDVWEVELDNGLDVKVDANSGEILYTEPRD